MTTEHVQAVDGQCGTCRFAQGFDYGDSPSGPEDGVRCTSEQHIKDYCAQTGNNLDLENFERDGYVLYFRLEVLAESSFICPHWQPKPKDG